MTVKLLRGDCRDVLKTLPDQSVHCCVTSPPYFGLRDYGHDGQIGLESSPAEYVEQMVAVFSEVRRVLRDDGTLWLNLGDSYGRGKRTENPSDAKRGTGFHAVITKDAGYGAPVLSQEQPNKQLLGIPWRVAFALQAAGWYLRQDIIWHKPNPMPESVQDRCTKAHEYVFLLSKSEQYFYDADAIAELATYAGKTVKTNGADGMDDHGDGMRTRAGFARGVTVGDTRNKRSVWTINTKPFAEAHFATMAPELAETCIKAGCPDSGTVLDPFGGAGTTGLVADRLQRDAILIELNPEYAAMAERRIRGDAPLFADIGLTA